MRSDGESWRSLLAFGCLFPLLPLPLQRRLLAADSRRRYLRTEPRLLPSWMPAAQRQALSRRHLVLCLEADQARRFASPARQDEYAMLYPPDMVRHPAAWGLEVSRPFSDRRLHEFLLAIPPDQKFAPQPAQAGDYAASKQVVRSAMRGILPEAIRTRTEKTVFAAPFERELDRQWADYATAFGPGGQSEVARRGYVDAERFWLRLQALRAGKRGADFLYILQMVGLESWLRTFLLPRQRAVTVTTPGTVSVGAPPVQMRSTLAGE